MPIGGHPGGSFGSTIFNADVDPNADIDPTKMAFTSMGARNRKTTLQSIGDSSITPINFSDGDSFDNVPSGYSGIHDPSSNPSRWVLRQKGLWIVTASLVYQGVAGGVGTVREAFLTLNGVTAFMTATTYISTAGNSHGINLSGIVYASVNTDYIELQAYHTHGSPVNVGDYGLGTYMSVAFLGDNS
jgi:hypothetical protein